MSGRRGNGDPFSQFGGDPFAGFGGFGGHQSLASSFFGGRDPFDDPFFKRPFGGMLGPMMNADPFNMGSHMMNSHQSGFSTHGPIMNAHQSPGAYRSKGPIIEEINSDDEVVEDEEKKHALKKHCRSNEGPSAIEGRRGKQLQGGNNFNTVNNSWSNSRSQSFTFQSSSVTYGGSDGAYYTKSRSMRTGSDGLTIDETKEADSTTGRASHKLSRGIYDKGHTVSRNLQSDGRVDTKQILHNINEDELVGFEEAWGENAGKHLPGWREGLRVQNGPGSSAQVDQHSSRGGWALPSTEGDGTGSSQVHTATGRARRKVGDAKRSARRRSGGN